MAFSTLFHIIAVINFVYGWYYDRAYMTEPDNKFRGFEFGGRMIYLTIWNLTFLCVYFIISLLNDLIGTNEAVPKNSPFIRKIRDYLFAIAAFPFSFNVGLMFWVLMFVDRELVMPKEVDEFFPLWLNHLVHTSIMVFVTIEMFALPRKYPSRKSAMTGIIIIMAIYLGWIFCIKANTNRWVYPILAVLNWPQRIAFFAFTLSVPLVLYFVGEYFNNLVWKSAVEEKTPSKKKKQKQK
ncbi:hypothetical protein PVAND_005919 [Polypedilum vanderplanki]|uniref:Uncharacterized protein n=1 Tax=Polypedilum vanderplanki TaxID=319348 RepID=A0A9J6C1J8_POLVA|nr:hypothetical protein PVAND_005919 [Polypedilum vanderplanki]